jgi:uncharacterized protein (DUF1697 family)
VNGRPNGSARVALLRAVNVGGRSVAMADLRRLTEEAGFSHVRTLLQSGNLLFRTDPRPTRTIETLLEQAFQRRVGFPTDFIVRTSAEWTASIARNPFAKEARDDPAHLLTVFLKRPPSLGGEQRLRGAVRGREQVRVVDRQVYITYPDGIARSRVTLPLVEALLGARGTGRNWNTVTKLAAMANG